MTRDGRRRQWVAVQAWAAVFVPFLIYVYANAAVARGSVTLVVAGVIAPVTFCLALHLEFEARHQRTSRLARYTGTTVTALVLLTSGLWSWVHLIRLMHEFFGMPLWQAFVLPVLTEALLISALVSLHEQRQRRWQETAAVEEGRRLAMPIEQVISLEGEMKIGVEQETDATVLYQLFSIDDVLIWVGITSNIEQRLRTHRARKGWWSEVATMVVRTYPTRAQALAVEEHLISTSWPLHNIAPGTMRDAVTVTKTRTSTVEPSPSPRVTQPERRTVNLAAVRRPVDELEQLPRDELRDRARAEGVSIRGSRAEIATRIRRAHDAERHGHTSPAPPVTGTDDADDEPDGATA